MDLKAENLDSDASQHGGIWGSCFSTSLFAGLACVVGFSLVLALSFIWWGTASPAGAVVVDIWKKWRVVFLSNR
jgi:hypothetical protein